MRFPRLPMWINISGVKPTPPAITSAGSGQWLDPVLCGRAHLFQKPGGFSPMSNSGLVWILAPASPEKELSSRTITWGSTAEFEPSSSRPNTYSFMLREEATLICWIDGTMVTSRTIIRQESMDSSPGDPAQFFWEVRLAGFLPPIDPIPFRRRRVGQNGAGMTSCSGAGTGSSTQVPTFPITTVTPVGSVTLKPTKVFACFNSDLTSGSMPTWLRTFPGMSAETISTISSISDRAPAFFGCRTMDGKWFCARNGSMATTSAGEAMPSPWLPARTMTKRMWRSPSASAGNGRARKNVRHHGLRDGRWLFDQRPGRSLFRRRLPPFPLALTQETASLPAATEAGAGTMDRASGTRMAGGRDCQQNGRLYFAHLRLRAV